MLLLLFFSQGLYSDQAEFLDSRAEAKKAHAERIKHLRQVRVYVQMYFGVLCFLGIFCGLFATLCTYVKVFRRLVT